MKRDPILHIAWSFWSSYSSEFTAWYVHSPCVSPQMATLPVAYAERTTRRCTWTLTWRDIEARRAVLFVIRSLPSWAQCEDTWSQYMACHSKRSTAWHIRSRKGLIIIISGTPSPHRWQGARLHQYVLQRLLSRQHPVFLKGVVYCALLTFACAWYLHEDLASTEWK